MDPWGDDAIIPLSTARATATRGGIGGRNSSDEDSNEERVMGITKTVGFNVEGV